MRLSRVVYAASSRVLQVGMDGFWTGSGGLTKTLDEQPLRQPRCEERGRRDADEATVTRHNSATQNGPIGAASVARGSEAALGGQPHR